MAVGHERAVPGWGGVGGQPADSGDVGETSWKHVAGRFSVRGDGEHCEAKQPGRIRIEQRDGAWGEPGRCRLHRGGSCGPYRLRRNDVGV